MKSADYSLACRAVAGDQLACTEIYDSTKSRLFAICMSMTYCHEDAEDLMQDTYLLAFKNLYRYRGDAKLSTWLYRICLNIHLMRKRKHSLPIVAIDHYLFDTLARFSKQPLLVDWVLKKKIEAAIQSLGAKNRVIFILRVVEKKTAAEAAKVVGGSVSAVKSRGYRAQQELQEALHECR